MIDDLETMLVDDNDLQVVNELDILSKAQEQFLESGQVEHIDTTRLIVLQIEDAIQQSDMRANEQRQATELISEYDDKFNQLVRLEQNIAVNQTIFQEETEEISNHIQNIEQQSELSLHETRRALNATTDRVSWLLLVSGLITLVLAGLVATIVINRVLGPLTQLTIAANTVSAGNYSQKVEISIQDEFATVADAFNTMADEIYILINALEHRVEERTKALTASSEVSRRISTILDIEKLVGEVVTLIKDAFGFYHVHIYLLDHTKQVLRMVGGTGEAGQAMLIGGHSIPKGKGLVGTAAETGEILNVPDVKMNPDWLANPLLPDTRAEVALPVKVGTEVLGVLDVQHDIPNGVSQEMVDLLENIGNQLGVALQNAEVYEEAKGQTEREALIHVISQKIQSASTIDDVLQVAARELGLALGAENTRVQINSPRILSGEQRNGSGS